VSFRNQTPLTWAKAKARVASVTGNADDADVKIDAGYAIEESIRAWENRRDWKYTLISPYFAFSGTWTGTVCVPTTAATTQPPLIETLGEGMIIAGNTPTVYITDVGTSVIIASGEQELGDGTHTLEIAGYYITNGTSTIGVPRLFKKVYDIRLVDNARRLNYIDRRYYDSVISNQSTTDIPSGYVVDTVNEAQTSAYNAVITLVPTSGVTDTLLMRWYRRHFVPADITNGSTSSDTHVVDLPEQHVGAVLARARGLLLANRGGDSERQSYWERQSERLYRESVVADEDQPDKPVGFVPAPYRPYGGQDIGPYIEDTYW
jgi:hypothetical protein